MDLDTRIFHAINDTVREVRPRNALHDIVVLQ